MELNENKEKLIKILFERLDIAMEFERSKKIVLPETTCIIRDIMKISDIEINYGSKKTKKNSSSIESIDLDF